MDTTFSRNLACLRKDRGLSQRKAAEELGVSQALLSHYENGVREPGLEFVRHACDFYNVSADYILGRSMDRDGAIIAPDELYDYGSAKDNVLRGSASAAIYKKLLINSIGMLFDLLGKTGNRSIIKASSDRISEAVYSVFRQLHRSRKEASEDFFSLQDKAFTSGLCHNDALISEYQLKDALAEHVHDKGSMPALDNESLSQSNPALYRSLLQVLHDVDARVKKQLD